MMARKWTRNDRLAAIIAERGLSTKGFRRSLWALVKEVITDEMVREIQEDDKISFPDEPPQTPEEIRAQREAMLARRAAREAGEAPPPGQSVPATAASV